MPELPDITVYVEALESRVVGHRLEDDLFLVIHLMIAGRLRWVESGARVPGKTGLAAFDFPNGTLILTEAGSKRRASLWLVRGESSLVQFERGGLEVFESTLAEFAERLARENHTLKRSLTDPRLFSGIGNAYSDEILHRARLSPVKHTRRLTAGKLVADRALSRLLKQDWPRSIDDLTWS